MRGSIKAQVGAVLKCITNYGTSSRHAEAMVRAKLKTDGISSKNMSHAIAVNTGIYGVGTRDKIFSRLTEIADFCRSEYGVKDISRITPAMVNEFLTEKIEQQLTFGHVSSYIESLNKLEYGLVTLIGAERVDYFSASRPIMREAKAECPSAGGRDRAYSNPVRIITNMTRDTHKLAAAIQHDTGLRVAAVSDIKASQLLGFKSDEHTGQRVGIIQYTNKGGGICEVKVAPEIFQKVSAHIAEYGDLRIDIQAYRAEIRAACSISDERYEATHGLRYNYAQARYLELREHGFSKLEAMSAISEEMGHHRISITAIYLGSIVGDD